MQATTVERLQELVHRPYDRSRPEIPSDMHYERAELARLPQPAARAGLAPAGADKASICRPATGCRPKEAPQPDW
jgi:hypothetical protein